MLLSRLVPSDSLSITVAPDRSEVIVVPIGELDLSCVDQIEQEVRKPHDAGFDQVVIDLRRLQFMNASSLRPPLTLRNDAARTGRRLTLRPGRTSCNASSPSPEPASCPTGASAPSPCRPPSLRTATRSPGDRYLLSQ